MTTQEAAETRFRHAEAARDAIRRAQAEVTKAMDTATLDNRGFLKDALPFLLVAERGQTDEAAIAWKATEHAKERAKQTKEAAEAMGKASDG